MSKQLKLYIIDTDEFEDEGKPKLHSVTVRETPQKYITKERPGLAFGCRTHFPKDLVGNVWHLTPAAAWKKFYADTRHSLEQARADVKHYERIIKDAGL